MRREKWKKGGRGKEGQDGGLHTAKKEEGWNEREGEEGGNEGEERRERKERWNKRKKVDMKR